LLVLSGGAKAHGGRTEAAAMAAYLGDLGIPAQDLVLEERSTTTPENLRYSAALLAERPVAPPVVVVTSDFHVRRAAALARRLGPEVQVVGVATAVSLRIPAMLRELRLLLGQHGWSTAAGCVALTAAARARSNASNGSRRRARTGGSGHSDQLPGRLAALVGPLDRPGEPGRAEAEQFSKSRMRRARVSPSRTSESVVNAPSRSSSRRTRWRIVL
jgi:hypothetical protein